MPTHSSVINKIVEETIVAKNQLSYAITFLDNLSLNSATQYFFFEIINLSDKIFLFSVVLTLGQNGVYKCWERSRKVPKRNVTINV